MKLDESFISFRTGENWKDVLEASPLPMLICTMEGSDVFINRAFRVFFGYGDKPPSSARELFVQREIWENISHHRGTWDGYARLAGKNGEEFILKVTAGNFHSVYLMIYFSETTETGRKTFIQGQLLKASSICSGHLISGTSFPEGIRKVVEIMGKAVKADRCYVYRNLPESTAVKEEFLRPLSMWSSTSSSLPGEETLPFYTKDFFAFAKHFKQQKYLRGTKKSVTGKIRAFMDQRGAASLLCLPIYKENILWGLIGFDDCKNEREWNEQEVTALELLTNTIASVLSRQELREELLKKNEQLESAIRGSRDSLWDYDINKGKFYYSPQFLKLIRYKEQELSNTFKDLSLFVHPDSYEKLFGNLTLFIQKIDALRDLEICLITKDRQVKWTRISLSSTRDTAGNLLRISGSNTDITLEKEYQLSIKESREKYRELVDNLREVVFQLDRKKNITFLNEAWNYLTGTSISESLGKKFRHFLHRDDIARFNSIFSHLIRHENAHLNCLVRIKKDQGEEIWAEIYARSNFREKDNPYILGTIIDVSQRYVTEQKLKESEEKYRLISDNISDMVSLQDEKQRFLYVSPSVRQILGYEPEEMLGKLPAQAFKANKKNMTPWLRINYQDINEQREIYPFSKKNGEKIWLETVGKLVVSVHGPLIIQRTTRDITTHKVAELNLKKALEKQKELNQLKSDFISMASHEFSTPLTTIRSSVQLLEEYCSDLPENRKFKMQRHHERIKSQIKRVTSLMSDVLTLGRFEAGKTPFLPKKLRLDVFLAELISEHFSNMPDGRTIEKRTEGKPFLLPFDALLMTHVFINIISNAFKYSEGRKNPELLIRFEKGKAFIHIKDYGIGIPENEQGKVFESFYRARNAIGFPGTGLGLVITKEFVELHRGTITISSRVNSYTEMVVALPKNQTHGPDFTN
jgi:PAS domain S-box-containing protein